MYIHSTTAVCTVTGTEPKKLPGNRLVYMKSGNTAYYAQRMHLYTLRVYEGKSNLFRLVGWFSWLVAALKVLI